MPNCLYFYWNLIYLQAANDYNQEKEWKGMQ